MSWRDPSTYIFHFDDGEEIGCGGLIGIFSYDCRLDSTYEELGIKSFESYLSQTRDEYLAELKEWGEEMPESLRTEEVINSYPETRKYFSCAEGLEMTDRLERHFRNVLDHMEEHFTGMQKKLGREKEVITGDDVDELFDRDLAFREPERWERSSGFAYSDSGYWFACAKDEDAMYSKTDIAHIRLLVDFLAVLKTEFDKRKETGGWYLSMHIPY
jgi:hypothetical protein